MKRYETIEDLRNIPILDNGEPLVDFVAAGIPFAPRHPVFPFPRVHLLRQGVVERLADAMKRVPRGYRVEIVEGYRPMLVQRLQFEANRRRIVAQYPGWPPERIQAMLEDFSAPPDYPEVPPPHSTGGAFDVFLLHEDGAMADMTSPMTTDDHDAAAWDAPVSDEARRNRDVLWSILEPTGITNYPAEYWHWTYGDQGWAHRGGHPCAVYGRLDLTVEQAEAIQGEPADRSEPLRPWPVPVPAEDEVR